MLSVRQPSDASSPVDALTVARRRFRYHDAMWRHMTSLGSFWRALPELRAACRYLGVVIELERDWRRVIEAEDAALALLPSLAEEPDTFWQ